MKKFTFIATLLLVFTALTASGQCTRILFSENYETAVAVSDTKWGSYMYPGGLSIAGSKSESMYLQVYGANQNQRSFFCKWGDGIYKDKDNNPIVGDEDTYKVSFQFCVNKMGSNQYNSEIAINAGDTINENYQTTNKNPLFKLDQIADDDETVLKYGVMGSSEQLFYPDAGTWYYVYLTIDKAARSVTYNIQNLTDDSWYWDEDQSYVLADSVTDLNATHLWYADARYFNTVYFDNITVSKEVEGDFANAPVIALTNLLADERTYTITFLKGETLHVIGTDGATDVKDYYDCDPYGTYTYTTTQSGSLQAYTTVNDETSDYTTVPVNCNNITLPGAVATISAVKEGYVKDYIVTIDKTQVPLMPSINFVYEFTPEDGSGTVTSSELASGTKISIPSKGSIKFTAKAYGYTESTSYLENNVEYEVKQTIDFQNMTGDDLSQKYGFSKMSTNIQSATAGGENNWTARNRIYCEYNPVEGSQGTTWSMAYPFGKSDAGPGIERYQYMQSKLTEDVASTLFCVDGKGIKTWWNTDSVTTWNPNVTGHAQHMPLGQEGYTSNLKIYPGIGLVCAGSVGDYNDFDPLGVGYGNILNQYLPLYPQGYTANDFVVVYKVEDYGSTALHPQYNTTSESEALANYKKEILGTTTETYPGNTTSFTFYRVDTAISRIEFLSPVGGATIKGDVNGDGYVNAGDINAILTVMTGGAANPKADVNGDGFVNAGDINAVLTIMTGGSK